MQISIDGLMELASHCAQVGGQTTLNHFNTSVEVIRKGDDSPVTIADRNAEQRIREEIRANFDHHNIIGEEFGTEDFGDDYTWIIDPIDGTQSFIHGIPLYTTLIGVLFKKEPIIGVIYAPVTNELALGGKGQGAYFNGSKARVRATKTLKEATFLTTDHHHIQEHGFGSFFDSLVKEVRLHRTWGDAYGHMKVAVGQADIMFDPILNIWDAAALLPIVSEAGGIFCDVHGNQTIETGNGFSCVPSLQQPILELINTSRNV